MLLANRIATSLDPWRVMRALEDQWSQNWGDWFENAQLLQSQAPLRLWTGDGQAVVEFDLPGLTPEGIEISVHENRLKVDAQPADEAPPAGEEFHLHERLPATSREVRLPFAVDPQKTEATYQHGVLRVTVHQPESHRPARIVVKG
jgi:HSP20 family protein